MAEQNTENIYHFMENLDFTLSNHPIQSSLPSAEICLPTIQDMNIPDAFCEINAIDAVMTSESNQAFNDILDSLRSVEGFYPTNLFLDYLSGDGGGDADMFNTAESSEMTQLIQSVDERSVMIKTSNSVLPVCGSHVEKSTNNPSDQSIELSNSVAVTDSARNQLQLPYALEISYRARYKSDYFPQNGAVRRPRYVTDNLGNHFVTLKMPPGYNRDSKHEYIRVALITVANDEHDHYYSPYKFQVNHNDAKVPDQNPIYIPVQLSDGSDSMKLLLVLIKSKLDQLYDAQPLKPFSNKIGSIQNIISDEKLASKDLINKYQLDKSHIAFTLCTKLPDGSYDVHSETTIVSSVIAEIATKVSVASSTVPSLTKANPVKQISCPNCQHCFDPNNISVTEKGTKRKTTSNSSRTVTKTTTNKRVNKTKKNT